MGLKQKKHTITLRDYQVGNVLLGYSRTFFRLGGVGLYGMDCIGTGEVRVVGGGGARLELRAAS